MSIQTEITRISGNVSDALDAIAAKGVTVPSGSNSDDMATLIGQISTGGNVETNRVAEIYPEYIAQETSTFVIADPITPSTGYDAMAQVTVNIEKGVATPQGSLSATGATVSTGTNTLTLSKNIFNTPQVTGGYILAGTQDITSVSLTASITTKSAQTYTPTTSDQTITSGQYLTGTQTIKGDANLVAGNIKKDVSIFGVTGTYEVSFSTIRTGSGAPSSSLGVDGDIYIQTS